MKTHKDRLLCNNSNQGSNFNSQDNNRRLHAVLPHQAVAEETSVAEVMAAEENINQRAEVN